MIQVCCLSLTLQYFSQHRRCRGGQMTRRGSFSRTPGSQSEEPLKAPLSLLLIPEPPFLPAEPRRAETPKPPRLQRRLNTKTPRLEHAPSAGCSARNARGAPAPVPPHSPSGCSPCSAAAAPPGTPGSAEGSGAHHRGRSRSPAWLRGAGRGGSHGSARLGSAREAGMEGGGAAGGPGSLLRLSRLRRTEPGPGRAAPWDGGTRWRGWDECPATPRGWWSHTPLGTATGALVSRGVALCPAGDEKRDGGGDIHCWGQRWWQCPAIRPFLPVCARVASCPPGVRGTNASHSPPRLSQGHWWGSDAVTADLQRVNRSLHHHRAVPGTPTPNPTARAPSAHPGTQHPAAAAASCRAPHTCSSTALVLSPWWQL